LSNVHVKLVADPQDLKDADDLLTGIPMGWQMAKEQSMNSSHKHQLQG